MYWFVFCFGLPMEVTTFWGEVHLDRSLICYTTDWNVPISIVTDVIRINDFTIRYSTRKTEAFLWRNSSEIMAREKWKISMRLHKSMIFFLGCQIWLFLLEPSSVRLIFWGNGDDTLKSITKLNDFRVWRDFIGILNRESYSQICYVLFHVTTYMLTYHIFAQL